MIDASVKFHTSRRFYVDDDEPIGCWSDESATTIKTILRFYWRLEVIQ